MPVEVLCIGHAAFDVTMFVEEFPSENSKIEIRDLVECGGGPAANAAYLLSAWGVSCAFCGLVGKDRYGTQIHDEFKSVGTDISLFELRERYSTPFSVILVNRRTGSRTIINRKAGSASVGMDTTAAQFLAPAVLLFDGHELEASLQTLELFPDAISILDAGSVRPGTLELAGRVDYLVASERFALRALGTTEFASESDQRACLAGLIEKFETTTIVTLGEKGLVADDGSGFRHLPAFAAESIDTTAAGDIFHGAFAYVIARNIPLWEGLRFASMAASLSVRVAGGRTSIPKLEAVTEALVHAG